MHTCDVHCFKAFESEDELFQHLKFHTLLHQQ
jgi:hypothetical protein